MPSIAILATLAATVAAVAVAADPAPAPAPAAEPVKAFLAPEGTGWKSLLDGSDPVAAGWTVEADFWKIEGGTLIGDNNGKDSGRHHHAFHTKDKYLNYELHADVKKIGWNAGLMLHEQKSNPNGEDGLHPKAMDPWWGTVWPDTTVNNFKGKFLSLVKKDDWNHFYVKVENGQLTLALNGVQTVQFTSERAKKEGFVGIGLHHGGVKTRVEVKNLVIRPIVAKP